MPRTGHFVLHSNVIPDLTAGRYELVSEQTGLPFTVAPETTHVTVAASRSVVPGVTHSATGAVVESCASPSATTTSASHGVSLVVTAPAGLRSHGSVRRLSTICGSLSPNAPSAFAGGNVDRICSVGIV